MKRFLLFAKGVLGKTNFTFVQPRAGQGILMTCLFVVLGMFTATAQTTYLSDDFTGGVAANWTPDAGFNWIDEDMNGNPADAMEFNWDPNLLNYSQSVVTTASYDVTTENVITLSFDRSLDDFNGTSTESMDVQVWDGAAWQTVFSQNNNLGDILTPFVTETIDVTAFSNPAMRIRMVASGVNSFGFDHWYFDNVVLSGAPVAPPAPACDEPVNGTVSNVLGTSVDFSWQSQNAPVNDHCWNFYIGNVGFDCEENEEFIAATVCNIAGVNSTNNANVNITAINLAAGTVTVHVVGLQPGTFYEWNIFETCDGAPNNNGLDCNDAAFGPFQTYDYPFTVIWEVTTPSFPGFIDGHFAINIGDSPTCAGTYDIVVLTGPYTTDPVGYTGVPAGDYLFEEAGSGAYIVQVTETSTCNPVNDPETVTVVVEEGTDAGYYWVGGTGLWSDHNNHWATTSGGNVFHDQVPTSMDNVYFDENSFPSGGTVTIDQTIIYCKDMDWTGADILGVPEFHGPYDKTLSIFGSLNLIPGMEWNLEGILQFSSLEQGKTILSAGKPFLSVIFNGLGGEWTLLDNLSMTSWYFQNGIIRTNDKQVNTNNFFAYYSGEMELHLGSSDLYFQYTFYAAAYLSGHHLTIFPGTSTLHFQNNGSLNVRKYGPGYNFHNVIFEKQGHVYGDNTFHELRFEDDGTIGGSNYGSNNNTFDILSLTPGKTYLFAANSTQTITPLGNFTAEGFGGFPIEIKSSTLGQQVTLHKDGDPICLDFLYLTDIAATGTGFTYAGANSDNVFNNSGWIFEACPDCFESTPLPAPELDPASETIGFCGQQAILVLQSLPAGYEAVWFNADQTLELYASPANYFQPVVSETTTFYGAFRDLGTGCLSEVLPVEVSADDQGPIFSVFDILGNIIVDNDPDTPAPENIDLGDYNLPEGSCNYQEEWFVIGADNCDGLITAAGAVTTSSVTIPAFIDPSTQTSVTDNGFGIYRVDVNWSVGTTVVTICMTDAVGNNPCVTIARFLDDYGNPDVSIVGASNTVIPHCATTRDITVTVYVDADCDESVNSANIVFNVGPNSTILGRLDLGGYTEFVVQVTVGSNGEVWNASYSDGLDAGFADVQITVVQAAPDEPAVIIAADDNVTISHCEDVADFCYLFQIYDDCAPVDPNGVGFDSDGSGLAITFTDVNSQTNVGFFEACGDVLPGTYVFDITYDGQLVQPLVNINQQANQAPVVIMPDNLNFTIPVCSADLTTTIAVQFSDDCDNPINANNVAVILGGAILDVNDAYITGGYFEWEVTLSTTDNGLLLIGSYTDSDGATTTTVDEEISVADQPDITAPNAVCQSTIVQLNDSGQGFITAADVDGGSNDNCGILSLEVSLATFDCSNVGSNTVTLTVTDNSYNVSTCTATVIVEDNIAPIAICQNITVSLDNNGNASITAEQVNNGSSDACDIASMSVMPNSFNCFNLGDNLVTLTVTDNNGNVSTCTKTARVVDTMNPTIDTPCPSTITLCGAQNVNWTPPTATDNCSGLTTVSTHDSGEFFSVGTHTVTYTFRDLADLTATCSFDIIINPVPEIAISTSNIPAFCQGVQSLSARVMNEGDLAAPFSYAWSNGLGNDLEVIAGQNNTTYELTLTDANGCFAVASYYLSVDLSNLLSAHVIVANDELEMSESEVFGGGVGLMNADEDVRIENNSIIHTFLESEEVDIDGSSSVADYIDEPSTLGLPAFSANAYNDANDITVSAGSTATLSGTHYGKITVMNNATLNFDNPSVYVKSITTKTGATIIFYQATNVMVKRKLSIGSDNTFNASAENVVLYIGDGVNVKQGSYVMADMYAQEGIQVNESRDRSTTFMIGLFITQDGVESGDEVVWDWNFGCNAIAPPASLAAPINTGNVTQESVSKSIAVYPNPSKGHFTLNVNDFIDNTIDLSIYNSIGEVIWEQHIEKLDSPSLDMDLSSAQFSNGIYHISLRSGDEIKTKSLVLNK